jgi:Xaa-Pro dipeptidase
MSNEMSPPFAAGPKLASPSPFRIGEFEARLASVRVEMRSRGIDVLLVTSPVNMYYLTGYRTVGYYMFQALIVPQEGDATFIVRNMEVANVLGLSWAKAFVAYKDWEDPVVATASVLRAASSVGASVGYDDKGFNLPPFVLDGLRHALPDRTFQPSWGVIEGPRTIKSDAEIACSREAARIASIGLAAAIETIKPGVSENQLTATMYARMLEAGGDDPSNGPFAVIGPRSALPHQTADGVVAKEGDVVFLEIGGCYRRYGAACVRTVHVGKPSEKIEMLSRTVVAALDAAIATIRPGAVSGEVDRAARRVVEDAGLERYWPHRTGYSIGLGVPPTWGEGNVIDIKASDPRPLRAGMIFHLVPGLFVPEIGAVMFSETILVGEDGAETLTSLERKLFVSS